MAITMPALRGKMGETEYFQATMKAGDLVRGARSARELDEWTSQSIDERLQREPDLKRIKNEIAPYFAKSPDRFFGSILVLIYKGDVAFESLQEVSGGKLPRAYQSSAQEIGFLTIDGGEMVILDGQHRMLALRGIIQGEIDAEDDDEPWPYVRDLSNDMVSVIFIDHESNEKTRRIFNKVNRYAKSTSRGDNIITSEDDAYAIIARRLLDQDAPLGPLTAASGKPKDLVNWKSNTLSPNSTHLTTISAVYEAAKTILAAEGVGKLSENDRPRDSDLDRYYTLVARYWEAVLDGLAAYRQALEDPARLPDMRRSVSPSSLLFKPAAQIALFKGLSRATKRGLPLEEAVERADRIEWGMQSDIWRDILIKPNGNIDASGEAIERAARLIEYLLVADQMSEDEKAKLRRDYNAARGIAYDDDPDAPLTDRPALPQPVAALAA